MHTARGASSGDSWSRCALRGELAAAVEIFHAQASALGVSLTTEMELPPSVVMFDPARILQVLTNLRSNAMKFTPAQGRVAVRLSRVGDIAIRSQ